MAREFIPSPEQLDIFEEIEHGRGHLIIDAKAGTGKSTTLAKAAKLMRGKVFYGVFNAKNAKEMRARPEVAGLPNVYVKTFHAAGFSALNFRFKGVLRGDPDSNKVRTIIDHFITINQRPDLEVFTNTVRDCVSMAKQRGIGIAGLFADTDENWIEMIEHFGLFDDLPEDCIGEDGEADAATYAKVIKFARVILKKSNEALTNEQSPVYGIIDFDDMIYLALLFNLRMFQHDFVLIDEAQDTNPTRRLLAERLLRPGGRLIAVGDPNQAIYGFSGADNDSLEQIRRRFNAKTLPLSTTYRCPKAVVAVAQQWVPGIHAHETAPEGEVQELNYADLLTAAKPGDMILCRYNKYLVSTCFKFIRAGVSAKIEGRAIGQGLVALCKKWKVVKLDALATKVQRWKKREMDKFLAKGKETKAAEIEDRAETVMVLIERATEQGITTVAGLTEMVMTMFDDNVVDRKDQVILCSGHRSKGLENPRVFVLGLYELMGRECRRQWETQQEINLQYVVVTRAQELLVSVVGVKEEKRPDRDAHL